MRPTLLLAKLESCLNQRNWFLIFDRDGTLVPYKPTSDGAVFNPSLRADLLHLAKIENTKVSIVSARCLKHLQNDFPEGSLILAGNYGMELCLPKQSTFIHPQAEASHLRVQEAKSLLLKRLPKDLNVVLDDHQFSLCIHWHQVPMELLSSFHKEFAQIQKSFPDLKFKTLHSSYEILPPIDWDKGKALEKMASMVDQDFIDNCLLLYVGDSEADEPAFQWVNERAGISVKIGSNEGSNAQYCLDDAAGLQEFVAQLLRLRQSRT